MKTKTSHAPLDVSKISKQLEEYENSPARGGLKIDMPLKEALRKLARVRTEQGKPK
jgi:hypothetical protein